MCRKDELESRSATSGTNMRIWGNPPGVAVTEIGLKKLLFSFKDRKKGLQILQNGPWNVRGNLINLRLWTEGESVFEVNHDFMEFWVQVHGIPVDYMSKETAIHIGNMLGVVAEVENPKVDGVLRRSFLRIIVSINIQKALPTGFWLAKEKSSNLWVYFYQSVTATTVASLDMRRKTAKIKQQWRFGI
ncbi:uncharacterized protein [Arachis hypogaea]|uniref:uncharacterized protein n=1 Tax=Arachis hypogaea TaxID=3818 RepID=UPI003B211E08